MSLSRLGALLIPLLLAAACGGTSRAELSQEGESGRRIANTSGGCASCHAADGTGGVGPKFIGLYGSQVTLSDGSTVVADDEYLRRAITDPGAQLVNGYTLAMPVSGLSGDDLEDVLAYIRELGSPP